MLERVLPNEKIFKFGFWLKAVSPIEKLELAVPVSEHICTEATFVPNVNASLPIEFKPHGNAIVDILVFRNDSIPIDVKELPNGKVTSGTPENV